MRETIRRLWAEVRWLLAGELLNGIYHLTKREASETTLRAIHEMTMAIGAEDVKTRSRMSHRKSLCSGHKCGHNQN